MEVCRCHRNSAVTNSAHEKFSGCHRNCTVVKPWMGVYNYRKTTEIYQKLIKIYRKLTNAQYTNLAFQHVIHALRIVAGP